MKKKAILILTVIAMTASLAVAGTLAWFTGKASVTNTFTAGSVDVAIYDENGEPVEEGLTFDDFVPGDTKDKVVTFKNTGKSNAYVRVKVTPSWTVADGENALSADNVVIDYNADDWVLGTDGWYYYKDVVKGGDFTTPLFYTVTFEPGDNDNDYQEATLNILIEAEAIQAENGAAADVWAGSPFADEGADGEGAV